MTAKEEDDGRRVVWILGAGFSRPLGLPLADQLFGLRHQRLAEGFIQRVVMPPKDIQAIVIPELEEFSKALLRGRRPFAGANHQRSPTGGELRKRIPTVCDAFRRARETLDQLDPAEQAKGYREALDECEREALAYCDAVLPLEETPTDNELEAKAKKAREAAYSWFEVDRHGGKLKEPYQTLADPMTKAVEEINQAMEAVRRTVAQKGWTAEEILVALDDAVRGHSAEQRVWMPLNKHGQPEIAMSIQSDVEKVLRGITRLIVAEMEFAIPEGATIEEAGFAWKPYKRWAEELVADSDTIITFNYDRVVEKAFELAGKEWEPQLLKLHGSVTTCESQDHGLYEASVEQLHLKLRGLIKPFDVRLGLPGKSKSEYGPQGHLADRWDRARRAISEADSVVFVGYRLPPEDVESMEMIVEALRAHRKPGCMVRLVLGPGTQESRLLETVLKPLADDFHDDGWYTQHAFINLLRKDL